ncbi:MFS transporter [Actinophytocola algeriensis]|uniref:Na+/melibiose symporter-like transporter n=1 Tax=Actinophytocola algeriensis TaxID=1768010 RepID=A0A7W7VBZ6_9PSEU|nr:MFS transporter [Actinophytocola algeriensis]MBB4904497.1 Na+/melibiose symporter-like transporter [Actinophytocola algeriensis]MBE1476644.1 Na+/melibiose symporter-like transporter [Actinophytocola algeriensis]
MANTSHIPAEDQLTVGTRFGYALGSLSTGAFGTVPGLLLLPYLTDTLGVGASVAGLLVLLPKAWDVVFNPIAGRISDRTTGRLGARRPYLLYGGIGLAITFAALFAGPDTGSATVDALYVAFVFLVCATAYAFFQVPYNALPAEMTTSPKERTSITAWRIAVLAVAILICGAGAPAVRDAVGGLAGYRVMGIAVGVLILLGAVGVFFGTARTRVAQPLPSVAGWRETVAAVRDCPPFRVLLTAFVIQAVGIGTLLAGVDYLARVGLGDKSWQPLLFAAFVGPALLVMPLWQRVGSRHGKRSGFVVASLVFAVGLLGVLGARVFPPVLIVLFVAVAGIGYAGLQVFPLSLLADVIGNEEGRTGQVRAGVFAGVWTAGETLGLALGPALYGGILALGGYVSSTGESVAQPSSAITAVIIGVALVPALFTLAALPLLRRKELFS